MFLKTAYNSPFRPSCARDRPGLQPGLLISAAARYRLNMFNWLRKEQQRTPVDTVQRDQATPTEVYSAKLELAVPGAPKAIRLSCALSDALKGTLSGFLTLVRERVERLSGDVTRIQDFFGGNSDTSATNRYSVDDEAALRRSLRQLEDLVIVARTALLVRRILVEPGLSDSQQLGHEQTLDHLLRELRRASRDPMVATIGSGGMLEHGDVSLRGVFSLHQEEFDRLLGPE